MTTNGRSVLDQVVETLDVHIRARYPLLYLVTHEEVRALQTLTKVAQAHKKEVHVWSASGGLVRQWEGQPPPGAGAPGRFTDPAEALTEIRTRKTAAIYVLKDFHKYLEDPMIVRHLRDLAQALKATYTTLVLLSPTVALPRELEKDVTLIDLPPPDATELMSLLRTLCQSVTRSGHFKIALTEETAWELVHAALGMTLNEAENAFAKAVVTNAGLDRSDINLVLQEKQQIVRKSGLLEFHPATTQMDGVGGLGALKAWLDLRGRAFTPQAQAYGLTVPRGVLLLGAPGCGKSLTAKAVASSWRLPLLQLDIGKVFSSYVGSSEENMRQSLKVAESIAPVVLWIDELEKGLGGHSRTDGGDGGVSARIFGTFLTWMQERKAPVFVVATANKVDAIPPEFLRRGRFDELFFVDLPAPATRRAILSIHIARKGRNPAAFRLDELAAATEGFSGAEIEHVVLEAMFCAFGEGREIVTEDLVGAARATVPLSVTYAEDLRKLRDWASKRARNADVALPPAAPTRTPRSA
jgi:AAA+ superfamily predicted ATPase